MSRLPGKLRNALAGLIAGSMLLTAERVGAATQIANQGEPAVTPRSTGVQKKVSPYSIANRRRLEAAQKERERSKRGTSRQRRFHPVASQRH
jgi:hypothetical protein